MSSGRIEWRPIEEALAASKRLLFTTHLNPDGDAVGSEIALATHFAIPGREVRIVNPTPMDPRFEFLQGTTALEVYDESIHRELLGAVDTILFLDLSQWSLLGPMEAALRTTRAKRVVIDHHSSPGDLGEVCAIDPAASSTGELVYGFLRAIGAEIDARTAAALFSAMATDTGWFRYQRTGAEVYRAASELVERGLRPYSLYTRIHESRTWKDLERLRDALSKIESRIGGRAAFLLVDESSDSGTGLAAIEIEAILDLGLSVGTVEVAALLRQLTPRKTKIHLRSKGRVDVRAIAARLGGGGHHNAAGVLFDGTLAETESALEVQVSSALERLTRTGFSPRDI